MKHRVVVWVAGATVVGAVALAACSGASTTSTAGPVATAGPGSTVSTPGTSPTSGGTTAPGSTEATTSPGSADDVFCSHLKAADDRTKSTSGGAQSKPTKAEIDSFLEDLKAARDGGPAELKESLATIIDAYTSFAKIVDDPGNDQQAMEIFLNQKVTDAEANLALAVKTRCGFTINSGASSPDSGSGAGSGLGSGTTGTDLAGSAPSRDHGPTSSPP